MTKNCKICLKHSGIEARLDAQEQSINVAKAELERRLEAMNEFREQLREQASHFISKETVELCLRRIEDKIEVLQKGLNQNTGGKKWSDWLITVIIAALISGIIALVIAKVKL